MFIAHDQFQKQVWYYNQKEYRNYYDVAYNKLIYDNYVSNSHLVYGVNKQ